jgi:hypothetical protein
MESLRIEELEDSEVAVVSWDLDECDPRVEGVGYYDIDFAKRKVFAEWPRWCALEAVNACDVRACHGCEAMPGCCQCCTDCGAPPLAECLCDHLRRAANDDSYENERAIAVGF